MKRLEPMRLALGMLLLMSAASAADFRIYPSFAEVREPVRAQNGVVTVTFGQSAGNFLVPGSLDVEGVAFESALSQLTPAWLRTQEGKQVFLKSGDTAAGKTTFEPVTLVRAEDLLVKDAQGRYRTATFEQLAFTDLPPRNPQTPQVQYAYRVGSGAPTLSYLTRGVSWGPRYTLRADTSGAALTGLADLRNATEDELSVDAGAELFAGEVNLQDARPMPYALQSRAADAAVPAPPSPKIGSLGELRGLQRYQLSDALTLPPQSTLTVPFLKPKIGFERYAALNIPFTPQGSDGKLSRAYRVKADVFLPSGPITVRDEGRIVGQASVDDTPPGEAVDFSLGADPDVSYTRAVQILRSDKTGASYRVTLTLENAKDRPVRAEVAEVFGGNATLDGQATRTPEGLQVKVDVPAKGKVTRSYTLSFKYGG